jgi:hypothetical protein
MLPLALALLLCAALALQVNFGNQVDLPAAGAVRAGEHGQPVLAARPPEARVDPTLAAGALFTPILTRPSADKAGTGAPVSPLAGYVVAGVVQTPRGKFAIVQAPGGGVFRASLGARVGAWRVARLGRDAVLLVRGGERLRVQLSPSGPVLTTGKGELP